MLICYRRFPQTASPAGMIDTAACQSPSSSGGQCSIEVVFRSVGKVRGKEMDALRVCDRWHCKWMDFSFVICTLRLHHFDKSVEAVITSHICLRSLSTWMQEHRLNHLCLKITFYWKINRAIKGNILKHFKETHYKMKWSDITKGMQIMVILFICSVMNDDKSFLKFSLSSTFYQDVTVYFSFKHTGYNFKLRCYDYTESTCNQATWVGCCFSDKNAPPGGFAKR